MELKSANDKNDISQGFLLTNGKGGFCLQLNNSKSKYSGVFYNDSKDFSNFEIYKIIEEIRIDADIDDTATDFAQASRKRGEITETYFMPYQHDAIVYEQSRRVPADIILDVKKAYDNRVWGRNYAIEQKKDRFVVTFTKKTDPLEGEEQIIEEYSMHIVIKPLHMDGAGINDSFEPYYYGYDEQRNSFPKERHAYNSVKVNSPRVIITYGEDLKKAEKEADYISKNLEKLKRRTQKHYDSAKPTRLVLNRDVRRAYLSSIRAIKSMKFTLHKSRNTFTGLYAGLPWFFQSWSRDELISIYSYYLTGDRKFVIKRLKEYTRMITPDGKLPNRIPASDLASMDALGWLFKRTRDIMKKGGFGKKDKKEITEALKKAIYTVRKYHVKHGMIENQELETWMDTENQGDTRKGCRIEMQALLLCMYELCYELTGEEEYFHLMDQTKEEVRKRFWDSHYLYDGADDPTVRPNAFMAAYIYPDLLSREEWKSCFQYVLSKCWSGWGGITSISKENHLFQPQYTGEDNKSYHRGDSWFFLNNMAAIMMHRVDPKTFYEYIMRILEASTEEIISKGVIGYHAEVSSASEPRSQGCPAQLWSSAMYVELIEELFD